MPPTTPPSFPRGFDDLTDTTRCPACFTPLRSTTCGACGLDLTHPAAVELSSVSTDAAALLHRRVEIIGRIRTEASVAPAPVVVPAAAPTSTVAAPAPPAPVVPPATPAAPATPRRHLGVQVVLLIVGVSLLAVGAIFFLVYAFITFGLVWRSVIIGAVTVAAFVGASLLRRRKLGATAEAIAALAIVLVYLDAFAVRANNLFGAGDADALVYWGITLLASSVGFVLWHRLSGLRMPSLVGFAAFAPGLAFLVSGLTEPLDTADRVFAGFAGAAIGGLAHVVAGRLGPKHTPERVLPLLFGALGLLGAAGAAFFLRPASEWAPALGLGIVAVLALVHVVVIVRTGGPRALGAVVGAIGAAAASLAVLAMAVRADDSTFVRVAPVVAAAVVALVLEAVARRTTATLALPAALAAAWTSLGIGALIALPSLITAVVGALAVAALPASSGVWGLSAGNLIVLATGQSSSVATLAIVVALTAGAWALGRVLARRRLTVLWAAAAVALVAVPLTGMLWAAVGAWLLLATVAVVLLVVARGWSVGVRVWLAIAGGAALALGYSASWASDDTWWIGSLVAIVLVLVARGAIAADPARATLLGAALVLLGVATGAGAWRANELFQGGEGRMPEAVHAVLATAIVVLALAAMLRGRLASALDARVAFWLSAAAIAVTAPATWLFASGDAALVVPDPAASAVLGSALTGVLALWAAAPRTASLPIERVVASVAIAPAGALALHWLARLAGLHESVVALAPVTAALLTAAVSLAVRPALRAARDAGAGVVALAAIGWSLIADPDAAWLVLLIAAVAALLVAISRDGLFGSESVRKYLGWASLALATASLWRRLTDDHITQLEAYVLPLAGALLAIALLTWRAARPQPSRTAPFIALAGLLVAILPLAADAREGELTRTIVVAAAAAFLAVLGALAPGSPALRPYLDAAAFAGALGVLLAALSRTAGMLARGERNDPAIDVWLAAALVVLVIAAAAQSRLGGRVRAIIAQVILGLVLAVVTVVELIAIEPGALGATRAITVLVVLGLVHLAAFVLDRAPFTQAIAWLAIGLAAIVAVVVIARDVVDPLEGATLPLAAALLAAGAVHLRRVPAARSWAWLAPGILVLLLPSLVATFTDDALWRLVALGLACVALIVVGALARLQAPLILGSGIVLVHAIRTFAPQLRAIYESTEWWVWAVVGGAIILFLGFTIERRIRDFKSVATRVSALR